MAYLFMFGGGIYKYLAIHLFLDGHSVMILHLNAFPSCPIASDGNLDCLS